MTIILKTSSATKAKKKKTSQYRSLLSNTMHSYLWLCASCASTMALWFSRRQMHYKWPTEEGEGAIVTHNAFPRGAQSLIARIAGTIKRLASFLPFVSDIVGFPPAACKWFLRVSRSFLTQQAGTFLEQCQNLAIVGKQKIRKVRRCVPLFAIYLITSLAVSRL